METESNLVRVRRKDSSPDGVVEWKLLKNIKIFTPESVSRYGSRLFDQSLESSAPGY
jgi:hypothetical protein